MKRFKHLRADYKMGKWYRLTSGTYRNHCVQAFPQRKQIEGNNVIIVCPVPNSTGAHTVSEEWFRENAEEVDIRRVGEER